MANKSYKIWLICIFWWALLIQVIPSQILSVIEKTVIRDVGSEVGLFVDDWLVEKMANATFRMHPPDKEEVVFRFDAPWEGRESGYVTVFQDGDKFRMYYRGGGESSREYTCLAVSNDGITWQRPTLGLIEFNGSKENNIIWTGERKAYCESHNFTPFKDTNPSAKPEEKYKAVGLNIYPDEQGERKKMLFALVSPDGIHWKKLSDKPIISAGSFDSQNLAFWDAVRNQYGCYFRISREGKRSISRAVSSDFLHWTVTGPLNFGNTPLEQFYTNAIIPYFRNPRILLGFPMRFVPDRKKIGLPEREIDGVSDAVLISSYDGINWSRMFMEAYLRPGLNPNNWGNAHGNNTPAWGILPTGENEISIYWAENYNAIPQLRRGTVRLDGFVSINAPYSGGELLTKPIKFNGENLYINYATSTVGSIRIEIQDIAGKPIPGFELVNCIEIYGDEISRKVVWKNKPNLAELAGKPIRLRFVIKDADLYSIQFTSKP
ncbi:MAG: hypothetical protein QME64_06065 [bacterium]|nr:hypothetical protein [bacterium]